MSDESFEYLVERVDGQIAYFDKGAIRNQRQYRRLKSAAIVCNVLTTMTIALAFTVPTDYKTWMGILALVLSSAVLATYQWEEFHNYGAKWEKFRLVAEQLRSEKYLFVNRAGRYAMQEDEATKRAFVEAVEQVIRGTDISYFALMVEPGRRIERRLESLGTPPKEERRA
jgi:hypothetical protein